MSRDVVWVLGTGSKVHDRELGCSMRSVRKHCSQASHFFVVGSKPQTNPRVNFTHVPMLDNSKWFHLNTLRKIMLMLSDKRLSNKFVLMNDDFFFCADTSFELMVNHPSGSLREHIERNCDEPNHYTLALQETFTQLHERGMPTRDYEIHTPITIDKVLFTQQVGTFTFDPTRVVPLWRSLYLNAVQDPRTKPILDCKLDWPMDDAEIERQISGRQFFSVGDGAVTTPGSTVLDYLERKYP